MLKSINISLKSSTEVEAPVVQVSVSSRAEGRDAEEQDRKQSAVKRQARKTCAT